MSCQLSPFKVDGIVGITGDCKRITDNLHIRFPESSQLRAES
jgi:hypothetical protein